MKEICEIYSKWLNIYSQLQSNAPFKGDSWKQWPEPFKNWTLEYIKQCKEDKKSAPYKILISVYFKMKIIQNIEIQELVSFEKQLIEQQFIDQILPDKEEHICKLLTTLLYASKRHSLQEPLYMEVCCYIIFFEELGLYKKNIELPSSQFISKVVEQLNRIILEKLPKPPYELELLLNEQEMQKANYFGSNLSEDSDSEEEKHAEENSGSRNFKNKVAKQRIKKIKDYLPVTTKGDLYKKTPNYPPLEQRWDINCTNMTEEQFTDLEILNNLIKKGVALVEAAKQVKTKFFVAQYRGIAYATHKWNQTARTNHRDKHNNNETGKSQYSYSVYKEAKAYPFSQFFSLEPEQRANFSPVLKQKAEELKEKLLEGRRTNPVIKSIGSSAPYTYSNQAYALQNLYTKKYDDFHQVIKTDNFGGMLVNDENPFISTGNVPKHALEYAYGSKYYESAKDNRLRPRWRKDGRAERPYAGKVYVSLHSISEYDENGPFDLPTLSKKGETDVINNILYEREATFPSLILGENIILQHVAKYPSFKNNYKKIYLYKYGLSSEIYYLFKTAFANHAPHSKENKHYKMLLADWLCCYHETRLIDEARKAAEKLGGVLVYHNQDGSFGLEPDPSGILGNSPGESNKGSREQIEKVRMFRSRLANYFKNWGFNEISYANIQTHEEHLNKWFAGYETMGINWLEYVNTLFGKEKSEPKAKKKLSFIPQGGNSFSLFSSQKNVTKFNDKISINDLFSKDLKEEDIENLTSDVGMLTMNEHTKNKTQEEKFEEHCPGVWYYGN